MSWRMSRSRLAAVLVVALLVGPFARPARAEIEADQVQAAIARAVNFLKNRQERNGSWRDFQENYAGGVTALCTLALLNAGVDPTDDSVARALANLRMLTPNSTYVTSLQTMVFCAAEPGKDALLIQRNVKMLEATQIKSGGKKGAWSYPSGTGGGDNSNSQFALLALYEAERVGATVQPEIWQNALQYWNGCQDRDGSWAYWTERQTPGSGSMTCAGITSLIIAAGETSVPDAQVVDGKVHCCGAPRVDDSAKRVELGIRWLARNFSLDSNPGAIPDSWILYYLYGIERVGRMTARRFIGDHDWYREGSETLVRKQDSLDGSWIGGRNETDPFIATSFALLFLAKGRRPVLIGKLKHEPGDDWNHHRNDLANLTRYVEIKWRRDLTWQVIDVANSSVEDLLQAPVLFINGRDAPAFSEEQKKNLRDYVDRGGFIFADASCSGERFDLGFRKLMLEIFPEEEHRLRLLPPEHPVWSAEETVNPKYLRPLWGIDVGCRTSVVYCPKDLSCYWELSRMRASDHLPKAVRDEVAAVDSIGINVLAYATNRELKYKPENFHRPAAEPGQDTVDRGKLQVAKLLHAGGCNAAPAALGNLLRVAADQLKIRVDTDVRDLALTDGKLFNYSIVFMHGRHNFRFTPAERKQLRAYLERGGVLFADSICSSREFTEAFRNEMKVLFPESPLARIPVKHPLFTTELGGGDLSTVSRRQPESREPGAPLKTQVRKVEPDLEGVLLGDRYAVIFSPWDISCALESHDTLECAGYTRPDAARIGLNVILYALHQ
jgi:hypothetical protein